MTIYIINWCLITLSAFLIRNRALCVILIGLSLFLILACRENDLGVDLVGYEMYYKHIKNYSFKELCLNLRFFKSTTIPWGHESGYDVFQWLTANAGLSFHSFLVVHAAICVFSVSYFIYKYSYNPWLSFILFLSFGMYGFYFGILRQALGQVILLFSLEKIHNKKNIAFFIMLCCAILFHRACILALPFYFISRLKFTKQKYLLFILICSLGFILLPYIFESLIRFFTSFLVGTSFDLDEIKGNNMIYFMFVLSFFIVVTSNKIKVQKGINNVLIWGYMLCLPTELLSLYIPVFSRFAICFYLFFAVVLIPNIIKKIENINLRLTLTLILYFAGMFFYFTRIHPNILPYRAFF